MHVKGSLPARSDSLLWYIHKIYTFPCVKDLLGSIQQSDTQTAFFTHHNVPEKIQDGYLYCIARAAGMLTYLDWPLAPLQARWVASNKYAPTWLNVQMVLFVMVCRMGAQAFACEKKKCEKVLSFLSYCHMYHKKGSLDM